MTIITCLRGLQHPQKAPKPASFELFCPHVCYRPPRTNKIHSFNHHSIKWTPFGRENESNNRLYCRPSTPNVFLFSLALQLLERIRRQERQTHWMINHRARPFLPQQYRLLFNAVRVVRFAFLCLYFLHF